MVILTIYYSYYIYIAFITGTLQINLFMLKTDLDWYSYLYLIAGAGNYGQASMQK